MWFLIVIDLFLIEGSFWALFDLIFFFVVQSMFFEIIRPAAQHTRLDLFTFSLSLKKSGALLSIHSYSSIHFLHSQIKL